MIKRPNTKAQRVRRHQRVRGKVSGTAERPRLSVFRSENNIYAQIIDDVAGKTLCSASTVEKGFEGNGGNCEAAAKIGKLVGESVGILTLLERLVAVAPRHYARHLAHLLREHRHICQFAEIAHPVFAYPAVHFLLSFLDGHSVILLDASQ